MFAAIAYGAALQAIIQCQPRKTWVYRDMGKTAFLATPCRYCGRTQQTLGHHSCDGCGAPR